MKRHDYLVDEDNDLLIQNGDFVVGESDEIHITNIVEDAPGDLRQHPEIGFNIQRYKNTKASQKDKFASELREQLQADGYLVDSIDLSDPTWWRKVGMNVRPATK